MPSNPNIALSFKSPQFRSPLETAARAQQLATNAMTMQKTQRETASLNALRDYIGGGGTLDTPEAVSAAIKAGANPDTVRALAAQNLDVGKFQAERKKAAAQLLFNRLGAVDRAGENGDDQPWVDWISEYGALGPEEAAEAKAYMNITGGRYDPAIVKSLMAGAVEYFKKTVPQATTESLISETGDVGVLTRGGLGAPTIKTPRTMIPDNRRGTVSVEPSVTIDENAPVSAEDAEAFIQSFPREAQAAIRQRVSQGALGNIPMGSPVAGSLVTGERGGVGGPDEGYVESSTPFRARVPAPPSQPQPRETADEAADKRRAVLKVEREFELTAPPKKLTPVQEAKLRDNIAKDYKSTRSTIEMMGGVSRAINDVRNLSDDQLEAVTGWSGLVPSVRASSRTADVKIKNLKGKVTEMGKAAASLSGAIGQMAVQEWRIVSDMIADLDVTGMEPNDLKDQLDIIEAQATRAANVTRDAYENQYAEEFARYPGRFQISDTGGAKRAPKPGSQYPVMTPEQVRRAPKGTKFRTTDGRLMEKQ